MKLSHKVKEVVLFTLVMPLFVCIAILALVYPFIIKHSYELFVMAGLYLLVVFGQIIIGNAIIDLYKSDVSQ